MTRNWWLISSACIVATGCQSKSPLLTIDKISAPATLKVEISGLGPDGVIPLKNSAYGDNDSLGVSWSGVPKECKSLVLLIEDPDTPNGQVFLHWLVFNILPTVKSLGEGYSPSGPKLWKVRLKSLVEGQNDAGSTGYFGPKPPDDKPHRYFVEVFAMDNVLNGSDFHRDQVVGQMQGHVLAKGDAIGTFKKP